MPLKPAPLTLELILIGVLARTPLHGYDLFKTVTGLDGFEHIWKVKQSNVYALLTKLESLGLLAGTVVPGEAHPRRRQFQVTDLGRATLAQWVDSPVPSVRAMRQDFFARLYFARETGPDRARALVRRQHQECLAWQASIRQKQALEPGPDSYRSLVLGHRLSILNATLAWLEQYLDG